MNPRIQKTIKDIEKTKTRIAELQARLKDLEAQRTDMENTEIVNLFRSVDIAPEELTDFIKAYKTQPVYSPSTESRTPTPAYQSEQKEERDSEE